MKDVDVILILDGSPVSDRAPSGDFSVTSCANPKVGEHNAVPMRIVLKLKSFIAGLVSFLLYCAALRRPNDPVSSAHTTEPMIVALKETA